MRNNIQAQDYDELVTELISDDSPKGICLVLIAFTGARPNEILKMKASSIEFIEEDKVVIKIIASKRSDNRTILLPKELLARMKYLGAELKAKGCTLARLIGDASNSIASNYTSVRRYFNGIQIDMFGEQRYTIKSFRHSLAIRAIKSGIDIVNVQVIMGHRSLTSTEKYFKDYKNGITLDNVHKLVRSTA